MRSCQALRENAVRRIHPTSQAVQAAESRLFQRFLTTWAQDCLALSRRGLDRPIARPGKGVIGRSASALSLERPAEDLSMIHWNPGVPEAARA